MTTDGTTTAPASTALTVNNLQLGTAPDSWGVWFPDDPNQVPWHRFLDEAAAAGYTAVELGPFGYLPAQPEQLRDELGRRGLTLTGATSGTHCTAAATPSPRPSPSAGRSRRCWPRWTLRT